MITWLRSRRRQGIAYYYTDFTLGQDKSSSVFNSISFASGDGVSRGDDGDIAHYRPEFVMLMLYILSASGELPGCVPIIWRK